METFSNTIAVMAFCDLITTRKVRWANEMRGDDMHLRDDAE